MATFTNQTKNTASYSNQSKNSASWSNQTKNPQTALAGQYYGFGAFTYIGGESLGSSATVYTNQSKN